MKAIIMAGGMGTRVSGVDPDLPKPMLPILDKPILSYQIEQLKNNGIRDITLVIGYLGHIIRGYFGDGAWMGVNIDYIEESFPLGTAGALFYLKEQLTEDFLLINGDILFDVDFCRFRAAHHIYGGEATILTHPNDHPYDSGVIVADTNGRVFQWLHKEDKRLWYKNRSNAGLHMLSPSVLGRFTEPRKTDLDRDVLRPMIADGGLFVYDSPEYVKDMGTPRRLIEAKTDVLAGKPLLRNLKNRQRAFFLDRDGTINKHVGFLADIHDFELIDGTAEAIKKINESGYLAIVITNQPVIARGDITWAELLEIHNKMETLLGREGAYLDDIFVCPHHPARGFPGERLEYKIDCDCRKPKPGLFVEAAEKYNIDLSASFMIGDSDSDMDAGNVVGCTVLRVSKSYTLAMLMRRWQCGAFQPSER